MSILSFKKLTLLIFFFFTIIGIHQEIQAQLTIKQALDINAGLSAGTIQATVNPAFTQNGISNVFDGNPLTMAGVQGSTSLEITLAFTDSAAFSNGKVYFWSEGQWSMEIANTLDDLNNRTGSYQMLVQQRPHTAFAWDSLAFGMLSARFVRLTAENLTSNYVYLGEWVLEGTLTLTQLYVYPNPARLLPGTTLQLKVKALDANNNIYEYPLSEPIMWSTESSSIATVGEFGDVTGHNLGQTYIHATSYSGSITGKVRTSVENDFQSVNAAHKTVKVALVLQDPVIDSTLNRRIHQVWNWANPQNLVTQIQEDFAQASHGVISFDIVETIDDDQIFTMIDSTFMSMDTLIYYLTPSNGVLYGRTTPGTLQYMAEIENRVKFNYNAMVDYYDFDTKRNNGQIDEIWVYTFPFGGMYESQLMGPGAFWYNSPPLAHPGLTKLLSVMGWNYERGVAEALHSVGHRAESTMSYVFGRWQGYPPPADPNMWEIFTQIDIRTPDHAHCGNIHYPPNGESDYDYANTRYVTTYADNWKRYPIILDQNRSVNREEWYYPGGDYQRGFMIWWFGHLPHYQGAYEGILNNWWHYIVDYDEAVALANNTPWVSLEQPNPREIPQGYRLEQNYPNPFNPETTIRFYLPTSGKVKISIYDVLGRSVKTILDAQLTAGDHSINFNASDVASGIYFYKLTAGKYHATRKMMLLK